MPSEDPDNDDGDGMSYRATANKTPPQLQFQPSPPPAQPKSGAAPMDDMLFMDPPTASHRDENPEPTAASPIATPLTLTRSGFLSNPNTTVPSLFSRSTHRSYDPIDGSSDRDADGFSANTSPLLTTSEGSKGDDLAGFRRRLDTDTTTSPARFETDDNDDAVTASTALLHEPVVRRASTRGVRVRHPTPGLQTLQGAYTANVVQLERSAEKLSMTSSIEDSIRNAYEEVKKSDSRMNSLRQSSLMNLVTDIPYEGVSTSTQLTSAVEVASPLNFASPTFPTRDTNSLHSTTSTSILDVNNAARSGGYSPGGAVILGARPRADSKTSKTSKYGTRPEPEMEGRPLSEFVPSRNNSYLSSRNVSRAPSIAEKEEEEAAVRRPLAIRNLSADDIDVDEEKTDIGLNKLVPDDSQSEMDQAQELFDDFDGQHYANMAAPPANAPPPPPAAEPRPDIQKRRDSSANTLSMARPKSYADPLTGQQMVFYPAPVPSMLMLPQKLSNRPSPAKREKRRTQALSTLPPLALQSAPWLQDVVEGQQTEQSQQIPDEVLDAEYLAQHHKQKVGGRRSTQDLLHMPEQLRANEFFEQPQPHQLVEIKEQSAVATLDNILDASAYAPVSAFTDHAYAGRLGAEVYGAHDPRATRTKSQLLAPPEAPKKRVSSFFGLGLGGGDKSDRARSSTVTSMLGLDKTPSYTAVADDSHSPRLPPSPSNGLDNTGDGDEFDADGPPSPRERDHDDTYIGAPTTLLAELQLRKQHAKTRTQNLTQAAGSRSTLLELDAVALVESKARQQKRVTLAWQEQHPEEEEEDDDVPLGVLFPGQALQQLDRASRPMGLMERRELEDNEPLSQRRDRLLGRGGLQREPLRRHTPEPGHTPEPAEDSNPLPNARPVSGAFSLELLNQFGDPSPPDAAPEEEEEETLGQRRRRLLAEREAAAKPAPKQRRSMADILSAHPAASRGEYPHLAEHLQQQQQKQQQQQQRSSGHRQSIFPTAPQLYPEMGMNYQSQVGGGMGSGMTGREMVEQMKAIRARQAQQGGWGQQQMWQGMAAQGMGPQQGGGVDMVERWRRSVMLPGA